MDVNTQQMANAALVFSNAVGALVECQAMQVANEARRGQGLADAFGEDDFMRVIERWHLGNGALTDLMLGM